MAAREEKRAARVEERARGIEGGLGGRGWAFAAKSREVLVSGRCACIVCARACALLTIKTEPFWLQAEATPLQSVFFFFSPFFRRTFSLVFNFIFRATVLPFRHPPSLMFVSFELYLHTETQNTHTSCRPISAAGEEALKATMAREESG